MEGAKCEHCENNVPKGEGPDWREFYPMADMSEWECYFGMDDYPDTGCGVCLEWVARKA